MAWANGYEDCRLFTFNVHPASDLTAFPNLIIGINGSSTFPPIAKFADVAHGGLVVNVVTLLGQIVPADLIFTSDAAGTALLSWEIEYWDNITGAIVAWVKSDRLAASDTLIYAWVGKSSVTTYQCTASATWNSNYKGVWHLGGSATGHAGDFYDSTSGGHNNTNTTNEPTANSSGQIDGAQTFDGISQLLKFADPGVNPANAFTVSTWINATSFISGGLSWRAITINVDASNSYGFSLGNQAGNANTFHFILKVGGVDKSLTTTPTYNTLTWYKIDLVFDGATPLVYVNGSAVTAPAEGGWSLGTVNDILFFGARPDSARFLPGSLDEVRLQQTNLSADWIAHEYRQQAQASAFFSVSDLGYQDSLTIAATAGTSVTASAAMAALLSVAATAGASNAAAAAQAAPVATGVAVGESNVTTLLASPDVSVGVAAGESNAVALVASHSVSVGISAGASATVISSISTLVSASVSAGVNVTAQAVMAMLLSVAARVETSAAALAHLAAAVSIGAQAGITAAAQAVMVSAIIAGADLGISANAAMQASVTLVIPVASGVFLVMILPPEPGRATSSNARLCFITTADARLDRATATDARLNSETIGDAK